MKKGAGKPALFVMQTYEEFFTGLSPEKQRTVELYQSVAAAMNQLYFTILARTKYKEWEDPFKNNPEDLGIGDCHLSTEDSAQEITDEAILELRNLRSAERPGPQFRHACGHHRIGKGCILDDLKSPFCLRYFRNPLLDEMRRRFAQAPFTLFETARRLAMKALREIQNEQLSLSEKEALTKETLIHIRIATEAIKPFPVLETR